MAAALACRRLLQPPPLLASAAAAPSPSRRRSSSSSSSSSGPSALQRSSSSSAAAAAAAGRGGLLLGWTAAGVNDGRPAQMAWRRLRLASPSSSSRSRVAPPRSTAATTPHQDRHRRALLSVPSQSTSAFLCQRLQTSVVAEGRGGEAARQVQQGEIHKTALNSARSFGGVFSQPTPQKKSERFCFIASAQSGGFATSSVSMETVNAGGAQSTRGDPHKLVTFESKDGQISVGVIRGDTLWSLQDLFKSPDGIPLPQVSNMESVIKNWGDLKDRLILEGSGTKVSEVKLLAPIPRPAGVIMCIGKNYLDHVKEVDTWKTSPGITQPEAPKHPIVFTKAPQSVIGPGSAIRYPHGVSSAVDYEAELGVIIGKSGQSIKREDAMSHIFGYTIINDVTARDVQKRHQQWFLGKSCDTFCPMGPAIVPASEIDGTDLQIQCWINDELRQDGRTSQMLFGIPQLIEVISAAITLQPGDIIATGTPAGVGSGFNPPRHLTPGDKIKIYIEGIGELCNVVE